TTTSDQPLSQDLGAAVRAQHHVIPGRLLPSPWLSALESDHPVHAAQGRADRGRLHAHGMGAAVADLRDPGAAAVPAGAGGADGDRSRLHLQSAAAVFPLSGAAREAGEPSRIRYPTPV